MARRLNETLRHWKVWAIFDDGADYETRTIVAHAHRQERDGGHRFYMRGPRNNSPSFTVRYVGHGLCRGVELIDPID